MDKSRAIAFVKKRLAWMDKEIIDEQMTAVKRGYDFDILPSELKYSKAEAEDLLDHLQNKNQRLFRYTGLVYTYADTRDALRNQVEQIMRTARSNSIDVGTLDYRQREGLNSVLPLGANRVDVGRMMTTAEVAIQMPFATQELNQEGGGYYGQNKESSNLVICNRRSLASPMGFVAGKPGSGKSFSTKREILNTILAYPDDQVIIFDPAGEYSAVTEPCGGTTIRLGPDSDSHLNPFDLTDVADLSPSAQRAFKIDAFLALSAATMSEGSQGSPRRTSPSSPAASRRATRAAPGTAAPPRSATSTRSCSRRRSARRASSRCATSATPWERSPSSTTSRTSTSRTGSST
jgi:type IV secretory pathway VirB4 component